MKNGSHKEETNVVTFKWKGMTSRVPLHAIQYDCANAITSCPDLFLF